VRSFTTPAVLGSRSHRQLIGGVGVLLAAYGVLCWFLGSLSAPLLAGVLLGIGGAAALTQLNGWLAARWLLIAAAAAGPYGALAAGSVGPGSGSASVAVVVVASLLLPTQHLLWVACVNLAVTAVMAAGSPSLAAAEAGEILGLLTMVSVALLVGGAVRDLASYRRERQLRLTHGRELEAAKEASRRASHREIDALRDQRSMLQERCNQLGRMASSGRLSSIVSSGIGAELDRIGGPSEVRALVAYLQPVGEENSGHFELRVLVNDALRLLAPRLAKLGCQPHVSMPQALPLKGARRQLTVVLLELFVNAAEASPDTPFQIRAREKNGMAHISVRDQGNGIIAASNEALFSPTYSTKSEGRGLGLAIAYSVVRGHGGWFEVESAPTLGTLFTLVLPLEIKEDEQTKEDAGPRA
jgi:signal transduction histidine kinase